MGTRAKIIVEGLDLNVCLYKHYDGYPEGTLPWLEKFNAEFTSVRGDDTSYKFAQLIRSSAYDCEEFDLDSSRTTGWGVISIDDDCWEDFTYTLHADGTVSVEGQN